MQRWDRKQYFQIHRRHWDKISRSLRSETDVCKGWRISPATTCKTPYNGRTKGQAHQPGTKNNKINKRWWNYSGETQWYGVKDLPIKTQQYPKVFSSTSQPLRSNIMFFSHRNFPFRSLVRTVPLSKKLLRSHLAHAAEFRSPHLVKIIAKLRTSAVENVNSFPG